MKGPTKSVIIVGLFLIVTAGIYSTVISKRGDGGQSNNDDVLDSLIKELTSSPSGGLPEYALTSKRTEAGYQVAVAIPGVLEKVPCYCSCGAVGHKSLRDCFFEGEGGFEEHASYCDLCVSEALDVYTWQKQGLSIGEIRAMIDEKYSKYGEPTDTPLI